MADQADALQRPPSPEFRAAVDPSCSLYSWCRALPA
jgi:hypothetical protein